jgi:hypothetical protein
MESPDIFRWSEIQLGMNSQQTRELLGSPDTERSTEWFWSYYPFAFRSTPVNTVFGYELWFNSEGVLEHMQSPFLARSMKGEPTSPTLITPLEGSLFTHYPRILDVRWWPCDGCQPLKYDLKLYISDQADGPFVELNVFEDIDEPYFCLSFVGDQPGQVSVRSKNRSIRHYRGWRSSPPQ